MDPELLPGSGSGTRKIQSWIGNKSFRIHNTGEHSSDMNFKYKFFPSVFSRHCPSLHTEAEAEGLPIPRSVSSVSPGSSGWQLWSAEAAPLCVFRVRQGWAANKYISFQLWSCVSDPYVLQNIRIRSPIFFAIRILILTLRNICR